MVTDNNTWLENLIENNGYSSQFLLIKVVNTVLKQNSFKSLLTWTNTALGGFDNLKGIEDYCDNHEDIFFDDDILEIFNGNYGKYDLIIIESYKLFTQLESNVSDENYDEVLNKILNNHLSKDGKLIILDKENLISGFPDKSNPYSDFGDFHCNDFRIENSNKLEASIAIDYNNSILILNRTKSEQTLIYNFQIEQSIIYFDFVYSNKSLKYWINFNPIFLSDELITQHVEWDCYSLLNNHLSLNSQNINENDHSHYWHDLNFILLGPELWDSKFYNYQLNFRDSNRNELNLFHEFFNNLVYLKNITSQKKRILTSYFAFNYFNENNIILKNTFIKIKSKLNINDFDFSSIFFEDYKQKCISFLEEWDFEHDFEESFTFFSENQFNVIAVDYENDFVNKNESVLSDLLLSLTDSNKEAEFDIFILVNNDILRSEKYENFRKEFTHYLHSVVKVGNEFMLWFKDVFVQKVFISLDDIKDPRLLKLKYNNIINFSTKQEHFYKNWIDTNHLFKTTNKGNSEAIKLLKDIKEDTKYIPDIKSDTGQILANTESMMSEVREIKSLTENTNESIDKSISKILESVEKTYDFNNIDKYIDIVTDWFKYWDKIEDNTKTFMPGSELLFHNIKISGFEDFSPFVLYYCRALENELLKKIFLSFHDHVNKMSEKKFKSLFIWSKDGLNEKKLKEYQVFFNQFKTNIIKKREKYTLGDMRLILNLLPNLKNKKGSTRFSISPLLKEFYSFIKKEFGGFDPETVKQLENIIINYRNKSAHVGIIEEKNALVFYEDFKLLMNKLIKKF